MTRRAYYTPMSVTQIYRYCAAFSRHIVIRQGAKECRSIIQGDSEISLEKNVEYPSYKLILRKWILEVKSKDGNYPIFLYFQRL
jgi:hypothetical protein